MLRLILLFFISFGAMGLQKIQVQEGVPVNVSVSQGKLNQFKIEGDRIESIKGQAGQFKLIQDNKLGVVFLQPLIKEKIQIFLLSESGVSYSLYLTPMDIDAEAIILVPEAHIATNLKLLSAVPFTQTLSKLITGMYKQTAVEGFKRQAIQEKLKPILKLSAIKTLEYSNGFLRGEILELKNNTEHNISLKEVDFYDSKVRAISIVIKHLAPEDLTRIFIIRDAN